MGWRKILKKDMRKPELWWLGREVRNLKAIGNASATLPPCTKFTVTRKYSGLSIQSESCPECGVRVNIRKVWYRDLEIWENEAGMPF